VSADHPHNAPRVLGGPRVEEQRGQPASNMTDVRDTLEVTGRTVARLGFGAMRLAGPRIWGPPTDRAHSVRLARRAVECGVQHIDTADSYGLGVVEDILREALHPYPERLLIATKIGQVQPRPGEWVPVGHPAFLRHQCEMSLRRLGVDRIELLYLHRIDPTVPFLDQLGALKELCPIPGTSSLAHLDQNIAAATLRLTDQQVTTLTAAANRHTPTAGCD